MYYEALVRYCHKYDSLVTSKNIHMMTDESKAEDMSFSWSETVDIEACNH
jgi:hypothetical protein